MYESKIKHAKALGWWASFFPGHRNHLGKTLIPSLGRETAFITSISGSSDPLDPTFDFCPGIFITNFFYLARVKYF